MHTILSINVKSESKTQFEPAEIVYIYIYIYYNSWLLKSEDNNVKSPGKKNWGGDGKCNNISAVYFWNTGIFFPLSDPATTLAPILHH